MATTKRSRRKTIAELTTEPRPLASDELAQLRSLEGSVLYEDDIVAPCAWEESDDSWWCDGPERVERP